MATAKRERQRANREEKKAVEQKKSRRREWLLRARRWSWIAIVIIALYLLSQIAFG